MIMEQAPWLATVPGVAISVAGFAFNLFGDTRQRRLGSAAPPERLSAADGGVDRTRCAHRR